MQNRYVEWGAGLPDLDNDGWTDVFYVTGNVYPGDRARCCRSIRIAARASSFATRRRRASRTSPPQSGAGVTTPHSSRGAAFGDIDNDGDVDVLVMNMNEPPSLLRNDYAGAERLDDGPARRHASNRSAIGATVVVTAGGTQARAVLSQSSYYSHDDLRLHFGLGDATQRRSRRGALAERRRRHR